jgi:hypothetical protein
MSNGSPRPPVAGGVLIMLGVLGGATVGVTLGEATLGLLIGAGLGSGAAVLVWLWDRGR